MATNLCLNASTTLRDHPKCCASSPNSSAASAQMHFPFFPSQRLEGPPKSVSTLGNYRGSLIFPLKTWCLPFKDLIEQLFTNSTHLSG